MKPGFILGGCALLAVLLVAGLMLIRRAGAQPDVGQDPRAIAAMGMRARKRLLILIMLVLVAIGGAVGIFFPATHSGKQMNTATSRWQ
jgi:hypothetical protein